jgi:5'-3' exonuclease
MPLYVFDGKPPCEKQKVIDKRKANNKKKNIEVTNNKIRKLKDYFYENNISYLDCDSEADFICGRLCNEGFIHGCISDDMDFLTLGCKNLYRNYVQYSNEITEYNLDEILNVFTRDQLIDISIFLGCDYCDRVYDFVNRSEIINVYELFLEYRTLEKVWNYLYTNNKFLFVDTEKEVIIQEKWTKAREILQNTNNFDFNKIKIKFNKVLDYMISNIIKESGFIPCKKTSKLITRNTTENTSPKTVNIFNVLSID